jgi:predicted transcriptional regulator
MTVVKDAMNPDVFSCSMNSDIRTAAQLMKSKRVRRLLVLNNDNTFVGILSFGDLASKTNDEHLVFDALRGISESTLAETI